MKSEESTMNTFSVPENNPLFDSPSNLKGPALFLKILRDWWAVILLTYSYKLRPVVIHEVNKVLRCKDPKNGVMYSCPTCGVLKYVPFTCKSRFCPSCGNLYNMQRSASIAEHMFNVPHRHLVFTIPAQLRPYFLENRDLLNDLFTAAAATYAIALSEKYGTTLHPGIIAVCHTFSRSSEWNPHIHCICTTGGFTDRGIWKHRPFVNYTRLGQIWQDQLLQLLRKHIGAGFALTEVEMRMKYAFFLVEEGKKPKKDSENPKALIKYLGRYLGRPCIASSRIDSYDGKSVKFHYMAHQGRGADQYTEETLDAITFLLRLFDHIQEPHFQNLRYFGVYSTVGMKSDVVKNAFDRYGTKYLYGRENHDRFHFFSHWRGAMIRAFHVDPLACPYCGKEMEAIYYNFNGKTVFDPPVKKKKACFYIPGSGCG